MKLQYSDEKNVLLMVALLKAHGIRKVIASPGTTNITFIGSLMHDPFFEIYSSVDERSAAYMACGMAEESGEPVALSCTGATASRNYYPGLTEAYYRKLPVLAITSTREECKVGHLIDQQIDRTQQPKDTVVCSEHLQIIKDDEDWWDCTIKINRAILALIHNGGGPAHINLPTRYSPKFNVEKLPTVRKIERIYSFSDLPAIENRDVAIFIGTHKKMTMQEQTDIDRFCEIYNAVVYCDICCGYHGKYGLSMFGASGNTTMDLLIHIGEVSCSAYACKPSEVWRVSEDGELRDTFRKLTKVFAMPDSVFFKTYIKDKSVGKPTKFYKYNQDAIKTYENIQEIPFSNGWIASYLYDKIPENSAVHLGIVSTFHAWNKFMLHPSISVNCNQGGFGIDGNMSSMIGASLANPDKLYFCFLGDLAFFYDMNALGNRHVGNNIRILLVNNGRGVIFRKPSNLGYLFQEEADKYMAAAGHYGNMSPVLVKNYVESLGFEYISALSKEEFKEKAPLFLTEEQKPCPMVFEVFVKTEDEIKGDSIRKSQHQGLKDKIVGIIGEEFYDNLRDLVYGGNKGVVVADIGNSKR